MTVTFSSTILSLSVDTFSLSHYHTMVGMFHMYGTNAKVTDFISFCTFNITDKVKYPILLFPLLSYPGPTRMLNSTGTGLAKLWGGWPIELGYLFVGTRTC